MEVILFFIGIPAVFIVLQYFLTQSGTSRWFKWCPAIVVSLPLFLCYLGATEWIPLPETYSLDGSAFLPFPDYWYVGAACSPTLVGLGVGWLCAKSVPRRKRAVRRTGRKTAQPKNACKYEKEIPS